MQGKRRLIGDRAFYAMVLAVAVPIMVQHGITSFVNLLDNVMVGRVGTEEMSGVAIANQLIMVFELGIFGGLSGAGIFAAQFFGSGNLEGVRNAFRIKLYIGLFVCFAAIAVFLFFGRDLVMLFLQGEADVGSTEVTANHALGYLRIMLLGFIPFMLAQVYASTLKECGETVLPMKAAVAAVFTNLVLNYILIFGKLGFPAMGGLGAAAATVVSRFVELGIVLIGAHRHSDRYAFMQKLYRTLLVPAPLLRSVLLKGLPLLANELLWSGSMAMLSQCYSLRGLSVVAAMNINSTVMNLFSVVMMAMGNAVAIIVGQQLGSGDLERAKDTDRKLIAFSFVLSLVVGGILASLSGVIPLIYRTEDTVRGLAAQLLRVTALSMPIDCFAVTCYFTIRSGGKTLITFLFDSAYSWVVTIPIAFCLVHFTGLTIVSVFLIVRLSAVIKAVIGIILVRSGFWCQNIVAEDR
ncbi:MAG: MATE family efflux transporter [Oscillospiraceae bacterium]|nr:MATE family efflux transporter [Oscillospiraceae bacterium]